MSNIYSESISYFGNGTTRESRLLKYLHPDNIKLDDRKTSDLLAFAADYARLINFYNTKNKLDGDWESFFTTDISVILATIISTNLDDIEAEQTELSAAFYQTHDHKVKLDRFVDYLKNLFEIIYQFDTWYAQIRSINLLENKFETIVETELFGIIQEKVKTNVRNFKSYTLGAYKKEALGVDFKKIFNPSFDKFHSIWELEKIEDENVFKGKDETEKLHTGFLQFRMMYRALHQALSYSAFHFKKYFEKSLLYKNDHKPDVGLYITFLELFRHHQDEFNELTNRYLHYYYQTYLKQQPLSSVPDKVHICVELANYVKRHLFDEGTVLTAGLDENGEELEFETLQDVIITKARIEALKTVYISRREDNETSNYKLVTDFYAAKVANSQNGKGGVFDIEPGEWPLFGEEQEYKPIGTETMQRGSIGFAIASPVLFLKEGKRKVTIHLHFEPKSTRIYKKLVLDVFERLNEAIEEGDSKVTIEEAFYQRIFNQGDHSRSVRIFASGNRGWIEADSNHIGIRATGGNDWSYDPSKPIEETMTALNSLTFEFELSASKPALVAYQSNVIKDGAFKTNYPIVKILVNDRKQPFIYSFLQNLVVNSVDVKVKANGIRQLKLFSELGMLDPRQPFAPFGMEPTPGASLMIGNTEFFRKKITDIQFNIEWKDIPETVKAFRSHYQAYKMDGAFSPSNYLVRLSALSGNRFNPERGDDSTIFPLFSTTAEGEVLDSTSITDTEIHLTNVDLGNMDITPEPELTDENEYNTETRSGYFRMELKNPDYAFGHGIYQEVFTEIVTANARNPSEDPESIPKQPYTPIVKQISASYSASTSFFVSSGDDKETPEKFFHIHPFGIATTFENGRCEDGSLLPRYEADGYLYIGLKDVYPPEPISILFQLSTRKTRVSSELDLPEIEWSYLTRNQWRPFRDLDFLYDSTDYFTKSGIIRLQLPRTISIRNTVLDSGICWIRIAITGDTEVLSHAIDIRTQAVEAVRIIETETQDAMRNPLPPETIIGLASRRSEVVQIIQPYESFGGRPAENYNEFFSRVSERLRHKNRAITHWDFERLLLNNFRKVHQAKCLSSLSNPLPKDEESENRESEYKNIKKEEKSPRGISHDEGLTIVAVPRRTKYIEDFTPKFNFQELLDMEAFLIDCVSPFAKFRVINPKYEYVRVIANVKFTAGRNNGLTLRKLNEDISHFLAPWLKDRTTPANIGGSLNENVLRNFIQGLPYVKFLTKFSLLHIVEEDGFWKLHDTAEDDGISIIQARPWGILLPDEDNEIMMVEREEVLPSIKRIDSGEVIRFQNRINILGGKKYIKIKNPRFNKREETQTKEDNDDSTYTLSINI